MPREEHPPLAVSFINGFSANDGAYAILAVAMDPRGPDYAVPAVGSATGLSAEHVVEWPNNKFTRVENISEQRVMWIYERLPGPILTGHIRSQEVRGRTVDVTTQIGASGAIAAETGNLIISSKVSPLDTVRDQRTTEKVASLPPDEKYAYWDYVPIPTLVFDIVNTVFCNFSAQFTVTTTPVTQGGASALRKHRVTVSYSTSYPNPDLSGSTPVVTQLIFKGKIINFTFSNVLNDAITYTEEFSYDGGGGCTWTEAYDFSASFPSATDYAAGAWYVREFQVEPWGDSGYRSRKVEYYSAPGNPAITP